MRERTKELDLARQEADKSNRAKSDFLAAMSHEIRTPMAGIQGLLELLEQTELDEEQRSTLAVARQSGHALERIIDGVLDFAKIEVGALELDNAAGSPRTVLEAVRSLHAPLAAGKGITLHVIVDPQVSPCLVFDEGRLRQVLNNFISNAIKFTASGFVSLEVRMVQRHDGWERLEFAVRDTGLGIPKEKLARLFQPFTQADAQTFTRFGGTGLGLFISRRLVEMMNGSVHLESTPGVGTTVTAAVQYRVHECDGKDRCALAGRSEPPRLRRAAPRRPWVLRKQEAVFC